jgi:glycosyltransferase involved in cell wall biosynthesis
VENKALMNKLRTVIAVADGFIAWNGGIDYFKYILKMLVRLKENKCIGEIILLFPVTPPLFEFKRLLKNFIKIFLRKPLEKPPILILYKSKRVFAKDFKFVPKIKILEYYYGKDNGYKSIQYFAKKYDNSIVFPTMMPIDNLPCKQIPSLFDLQHIHLPYFFTEKEINDRIIYDKCVLLKSDTFIINSNDAKNDFISTYPKESYGKNIFALPMLPLTDKKLLLAEVDVSKYKLPKKYFIICNQFWIHKDHKTAFKALKMLHKKVEYHDIHIVCTGNNNDYRFHKYFSELKKYIQDLELNDKIIYLGSISKMEQICILRKSIALIQPTLFEGGPGGGATYDAIAYGVPAIISDIDVNKEIRHSLVFFFKKGSPEDLSAKMEDIIKNQISKPSIQYLIEQSEKNIEIGAEFLREMLYSI